MSKEIVFTSFTWGDRVLPPSTSIKDEQLDALIESLNATSGHVLWPLDENEEKYMQEWSRIMDDTQ